jgi:DNA-binding HxlR family transcriptional regulator
MPAQPLAYQPDLERTRLALAGSTLNQGLMVLGDRWMVAVLQLAFQGVSRFDDWQTQLGIPRATLTERLRTLVALGLMRQRVYQERPKRQGYHLTQAGLRLYDPILMIWLWEKRWGVRNKELPERLLHRSCGHTFVPVLTCGHCHAKVGIGDLLLTLHPGPPQAQARSVAGATSSRASRLSPHDKAAMALGMRVDRWALLIITAVILGCHHFDQLLQVLGIASSVLARRLSGLVEAGLLLAQSDMQDGRRTVYRLTPASRDLFPYLVCFAKWAGTDHFRQPSTIRPVHKACGQPFVAQVVCSACSHPPAPWDVQAQGGTPSATSTKESLHVH